MAPSKKEIVEAIMTFVHREKKAVKNVMLDFLTYRCPKPNCPTASITFQANSGFQNPYAHLRSCYGRGKPATEQDKIILELYEEALEAFKSSGGSIRSHFKADSLNETEKAVHGYIRLIVLENAPLHIVDSPHYRDFSRFDAVVSAKTVTDVIVKLVELVEERIKTDIVGRKGALMFDGWSKRGVHYVAMLLSYMGEVEHVTRGSKVVSYEQRSVLVALSPMAKPTQEDNEKIRATSSVNGDEDCEVTKFNSETHLSFFKENMKFFGCTFEGWVVCLISDNCSTNSKIARDAGKPLIGCLSHKLNLQVNKMVRDTPVLEAQLTAVHTTMVSACNSIKNAAVLRNLTDLHAVKPNETRWSGKYFMLESFVRMRDELIKASETEECSISINREPQFLSQIQKNTVILCDIHALTKQLQTRGFTLSDCRKNIDLFLGKLEKNRGREGRRLYGCRLGDEYICINSHLATDPYFESGVVKLQRKEAAQLTSREKRAVQGLLKDGNATDDEDDESDGDAPMEQTLQKRVKVDENEKYIPADFIHGSSAEVERVWSSAKYVLTEQRGQIKPLLFEAIMFLKYNAKFWNEGTVAAAVRAKISEKSKQRLDALGKQIEFDFGELQLE